jgi:hypothetical protein
MVFKNKGVVVEISTVVNLQSEEEVEIAAILGCNTIELNNKLNVLIGAAFEEYLTMLRGQKVLKRGSDILEYRLFLLIKTTFNGTIPDEQIVSNLFQTTHTESRSLIRAVLSKYQYQLRSFIDNTMRIALKSATFVEQEKKQFYSVVINSQNIIYGLNRLLAELDGSLPPVIKKKGSVSTYEIKSSSYGRLKRRLEF